MVQWFVFLAHKTLHTRSQSDDVDQMSTNYLTPTPAFKGGLKIVFTESL